MEKHVVRKVCQDYTVLVKLHKIGRKKIKEKVQKEDSETGIDAE
jgi:hypothetical protein